MVTIEPFDTAHGMDGVVQLSRLFFAEYVQHHPSFFAIKDLQDEHITRFFERFLSSDDSAAFVALDDKLTIGYITVSIRQQPDFKATPQVGAVSGLMVHPDHRRQGVGEALMDAARSWLSERGVVQYTLATAVNNEGALAFYRRMGMEPLQVTLLGETGSTALET